MKIVVITDVHANLPALEAALDSIQRRGYDLLVHTGDAIGIGPFPAECIERLLSLPRALFVMGNHDALFAHGIPSPRPQGVSDGEVFHQRWTHSQLRSDWRLVIAGWPYAIEKFIEGVQLAFLHYPRGHDGRFAPIVKDADPKRLDELFQGVPGDLVFYGHHHPFSDVSSDRRRYVNPGSLGCAPAAVARYCEVDIQKGRYIVTHHSVPYDDAPLIEAFEARQVPERHMIYKAFFFGRFGGQI